MVKKIICFDLDNTICRTNKNYYDKSVPYKNKIKIINSLYQKGYIIKNFTARFMGRAKENQNLAKKKGYYLTKRQLKKWNLKYHQLIFGKPSYDLFIDDKNLSFTKDWHKKILKILS